ncbi:HU domain-containing protein [Spirosoma radiotolerans]|uniref:Sporulation protein n=1 Tax=Spirosoma radiotolerans TaxID=1379870 RepID=A0A0E3ZUX4_9BACT|nr:SPOR domain-containing protein [Spirosoma radiotolerans]AKD55503.1 sporulation protein [Spirosoma radiotolerans]
MAAVKDYLKKLLYQYDCVVVPELGAFLTHYQPAAFTETSGLYLPPRKRVAFNEALRFDDGILANYIMLHEPVTRDGAQKYISQFVNDLRQQVSAAGRFEIDGIGTFTHNEEGRLQFDPSLRHNFFGEAYGMSALSAQFVDHQPKLETILDAVPVTALGPVLVRDEDTTLTPYRPARPYWRVAAAALLIGSLGVFSYFSVINPGQPFQSSLDPANLFRTSASYFERKKVDSDVPKPVSVSVPAPAAVDEQPVATPAGTPAASNPVPTEPAATTPDVSKVKLEPTPAVKPASEAAKPELATKASAVAVKAVRTTPYYTVIAGVFLSKRNALRLKRQLRKAGYADAFVIMPERGQKVLRYKVAAAGSADRDEAVTSMAAVSELAGSTAWLYKN